MRPNGYQAVETTKKNRVQNHLTEAISELVGVCEHPGLESQLLMAHVLSCSREWLLAHYDGQLSEIQSKKFDCLIHRRAAGEPLPYLLGRWEFFGLSFIVTPDVLIPRPETELMLEIANEWLSAHTSKRTVIDVGTGTGCIGIGLAHQYPDIRITMTDLSRPALKIATVNAARLVPQSRIAFYQGDLLHGFLGPVDLICANLPYIPTRDLKDLDVSRHEPSLALDGGMDGMRLIRELLTDAPRCLAPGGMLLVEIEEQQGRKVLELAHETFPSATIHLHTDLAGKERLIQIIRKPEE